MRLKRYELYMINTDTGQETIVQRGIFAWTLRPWKALNSWFTRWLRIPADWRIRKPNA